MRRLYFSTSGAVHPLSYRMKAFVVAAFFCAVAIMVKADLNEEQKARIKNHHQVCMAETKVDEELVKKARQGEIVDDQKLKEHLLCVLKKIGIIDNAGEIKNDVLKANLTAVVGEEKSNKLLKECAVKKNNGPETAFQLVKCYDEKSGKHII